MTTAQLMIVSTTFPEPEHARQVCTELVDAGLAACGQVGGPVQASYRWEGELQRDQEYPVVFKVLAARLAEFVVALKGRHPYEVPQVVAWPASYVDPDYLAWASGGGS